MHYIILDSFITIEITIYKDNIYYTQSYPSRNRKYDQGEIYKITKDGKDKTIFSNNKLEVGAWLPLSTSYNIFNGYLYFIKGYLSSGLGEEVDKINLTSKQQDSIFNNVPMYVCNIKIDNDWLYYTIGTNDDPSRFTAVVKDLYRIKLDGSSNEKIVYP